MFHGMFHASTLNRSCLASRSFPAADLAGARYGTGSSGSGLLACAYRPQAVFFSCSTEFRKNPYLLCAGA